VVGNVGSDVKFESGARGPAVNLSCRVEGATKHLKCMALVTRNTRKRVEDEFCTRRLCRVKVVNTRMRVAQPTSGGAVAWLARRRAAFAEAKAGPVGRRSAFPPPRSSFDRIP
jgi:class 3 adenylate cyclase